jgi:twitching motility protein PilT
MATPGRAPIPNAAPTAVPPTPALLLAMLQVSSHVSDLIFSPGSHPHVEVSGQLVPVKTPGVPVLNTDATERIAEELIGGNKQAIATLQQQGSCDISYSVPGTARFRVNIFVQQGSHAIVMRVIPKSIPGFDELKLPSHLAEIVLVTGPTGSGKSSTLAAILDRINGNQGISHSHD